MLARRLLLLIALLLVMLAVANAVAPRGERGSSTGTLTGPRTGPSLPAQAQPGTESGGTVTATLRAGTAGRPRVVRARLGDLVDLSVAADVVGTVQVGGYDLLEPVDPAAPAEFHLFADRAGSFDVSLLETGAVIGRLLIRPTA
jgi:hypothetical protein